MNQSEPLPVSEKISFLELAFNDARDNLRFAESKAAFIAVVLTIAVTALPAIPNVKDLVSFKAFKATATVFFGIEKSSTPPLNNLMMAGSQMSIMVALFLCVLAVVVAIRAAIPVNNPIERVDLTTAEDTPRSRSSVFYPTGFNRKLRFIELLFRPQKDVKFLFSASGHRDIVSTLTSEEILCILGEQIIILGYIRDLKMLRVAAALRLVLLAVILLSSAVILQGLRFLIYG